MPQDYKIVCDELPSIKNKIHTSAEKRDKNLYWGGVRGVSEKGEFKRSPAILLPVEISLRLTGHTSKRPPTRECAANFSFNWLSHKGHMTKSN